MLDLLSAAQHAVFDALNAGVQLAPVHDHVKQNTEPPFVKIGAIESGNDGSKGDQRELITVEVHTVYRGSSRPQLLAIMHEVREALDGVPIQATGVSFETPEFVSAAASDAGSDGITYAGISVFEFDAEPE